MSAQPTSKIRLYLLLAALALAAGIAAYVFLGRGGGAASREAEERAAELRAAVGAGDSPDLQPPPAFTPEETSRAPRSVR